MWSASVEYIDIYKVAEGVERYIIKEDNTAPTL
jgi:hypothetical protein